MLFCCAVSSGCYTFQYDILQSSYLTLLLLLCIFSSFLASFLSFFNYIFFLSFSHYFFLQHFSHYFFLSLLPSFLPSSSTIFSFLFYPFFLIYLSPFLEFLVFLSTFLNIMSVVHSFSTQLPLLLIFSLFSDIALSALPAANHPSQEHCISR